MKKNKQLLVLNYHYIREANFPYPAIYPIGMDDLYRQVKRIKAQYSMPNPNQVKNYILNQKHFDEPSVFLTFDDGLKDHICAIREVLDLLNVKAAFFICTEPLIKKRALNVHKIHYLRSIISPDKFREMVYSRIPNSFKELEIRENAVRIYKYDEAEVAIFKYMLNFALPQPLLSNTLDSIFEEECINEANFCKKWYLDEFEIKLMADEGHEIGIHGYTHKPFSTLSAQEIITEIKTNANQLEMITKREPSWISYPNGVIDKNVLGRIKENLKDLKLGFTTETGWNGPITEPLMIKRANANDFSDYFG